MHGAHTIDSELQAAALAHAATHGPGATHVLTRNRHAAEIASFLAQRGLPVAYVHSTPSGASKHAYMAATLEPSERALFVDDAAAEVNDPRVAADTRIFRVLFQRG